MTAYRDDLTALSARHDALSNELAAKTRELSDATRLLEDARTRAKLPVLDNIRIASPCSADWSAMTGDERVRACGDCNKNVYNISDLTRDEAQALIVEKEGTLCVRYFQRKDGTILLKDCVIGAKRNRRRKIVAVGAAALLAAGGGLVYRALLGESVEEMGKMEIELSTEMHTIEALPPPPAPPTSSDLNDRQELMGAVAWEEPPSKVRVQHKKTVGATHDHSRLMKPTTKGGRPTHPKLAGPKPPAK